MIEERDRECGIICSQLALAPPGPLLLCCCVCCVCALHCLQ